MSNDPKDRRNSIAPRKNALPVYFLSLELERVLCFKDRQVLDLSDGNGAPAQWTVILGNNGVGKTTLLRCLASMETRTFQANPQFPLKPYTLLAFFGNSKDSSPWKEIQVLKNNQANVTARAAYNTSFPKIKETFYAKAKDLKIDLRSIGIKVDFKSDSVSTFYDLPESGREVWGDVSVEDLSKIEDLSEKEMVELIKLTNSELLKNLLENILCYSYGATRKIGDTKLSELDLSKNFASLFSEEASLINAEEWLLQTDYAVRSASGKTKIRLEKQFNQTVEILKNILPDVEDIRIAPADENFSRPRAEFLTPYGWVSLSGLGLGYRTAIAWMVDLAVRLFQRYPDSEDPLSEPAIVLVDEIDLHLHPKWQRTIMDFLTKRFPNTQFIVTAHSPLVVQAAKDANIVLLRREGDRVVIDNDPEIVENWRVDQVLTSVFELPSARPSDLDPLLARRQELLTQASLSEADEVELRELEERIGSLPTAETPDDIKAMDIIRRAAQLLENS
ncbi:MAG: AAA family ATPase [Thainema sp.]